jgi:hypothetical protein
MSAWIPVRILVSVALLSGAMYAARPAAARPSSGGLARPPGHVVSQGAAESRPTLRCTAQSWTMGEPAVKLVDVTCTVAEAVEGESSFRLAAAFVSPGREGWTVDPFCIAPLYDGQGACGQRLTHPMDAAGGRLTLTGVLRPSGQTLSASVVAY